MNKKLPLKCPSCESHLQVKQLYCDNCQTEVSGLYSLPIIAQLPAEDQKFILDFVKASGSLKNMAQNMKLSYPTVRNRLDEIISKINNLDTDEK
ncbi:MAG: DUF2089 family protein [Mangrovibacterium sp.]|jgi:hypothetical protein